MKSDQMSMSKLIKAAVEVQLLSIFSDELCAFSKSYKKATRHVPEYSVILKFIRKVSSYIRSRNKRFGKMDSRFFNRVLSKTVKVIVRFVEDDARMKHICQKIDGRIADIEAALSKSGVELVPDEDAVRRRAGIARPHRRRRRSEEEDDDEYSGSNDDDTDDDDEDYSDDDDSEDDDDGDYSDSDDDSDEDEDDDDDDGEDSDDDSNEDDDSDDDDDDDDDDGEDDTGRDSTKTISDSKQRRTSLRSKKSGPKIKFKSKPNIKPKSKPKPKAKSDQVEKESTTSSTKSKTRKQKRNLDAEFAKYTRTLQPHESSKKMFQKLDNLSKVKIIEFLDSTNTSDTNEYHRSSCCPPLIRVLLSSIPDKTKADLIPRCASNDREIDNHKFREWIETLLKIPFGKLASASKDDAEKSPKDVLEQATTILDKAVYGHQEAKTQIVQFIAQTLSNKTSRGMVLGIRGPMGNGKTTLIEKGLSKALGRPFVAIPLGGMTDGSTLEGHSYTYEGSMPGRIASVLIETRCMNPVIFFDELDKVSRSHRGDEIVNLLIHLTDPSQNAHWHDKYFAGVDLDLSNATFVFSYNDDEDINPILLDRITQISTHGFQVEDKVNIARNYLLPDIIQDVGLQSNAITIQNRDIFWIIEQYTNEGGVRHLRQLLYHILRQINYRRLSTNTQLSVKLTRKKLEKDYLANKRYVIHEKPSSVAVVGRICGLFATCNDTGGCLLIEASWSPSREPLQLLLTGRQGDVMQESMNVAKTVACRVVSKQYSEDVLKNETRGIHVHCPEASVRKDGPSAGIAISVALISLLSNKPVDNTIAVTGEVNMQGEALAIGGLTSKLFGAKRAGLKKVLIPKANERDFKEIIEKFPKLVDDSFEVTMIASVDDAISHFI